MQVTVLFWISILLHMVRKSIHGWNPCSTDFIIQLLLKNEFLSFVPQFAVQNQIAQGILTPIPVSDFDLHIWRQIVYHKDKLLTLEMKAFFQLVQ